MKRLWDWIVPRKFVYAWQRRIPTRIVGFIGGPIDGEKRVCLGGGHSIVVTEIRGDGEWVVHRYDHRGVYVGMVA